MSFPEKFEEIFHEFGRSKKKLVALRLKEKVLIWLKSVKTEERQNPNVCTHFTCFCHTNPLLLVKIGRALKFMWRKRALYLAHISALCGSWQMLWWFPLSRLQQQQQSFIEPMLQFQANITTRDRNLFNVSAALSKHIAFKNPQAPA